MRNANAQRQRARSRKKNVVQDKSIPTTDMRMERCVLGKMGVMQMTITNKNQNQARSCNAMWKMRINAYDGPDDKGDKERKGGMQFLEQEDEKNGWSRLRFWEPKPNAKRYDVEVKCYMVSNQDGEQDSSTSKRGCGIGLEVVLAGSRTNAEQKIRRSSMQAK